MKPYIPLRLKKNEERRLRAGHLWVYSNEVDTAKTPLTQFIAGQMVRVESSEGKSLGMAYVNPQSLICARLISRDSNQMLTASLLIERLKQALGLREALFTKPYYRWVFGEGDFLPGLTIDRYGSIAVAQITTAGMEQVKSEVITAIQEVIKPTAILLRNDAAIRQLEGLDLYTETLLGEVPATVSLEENDTLFQTSLITGQKTGWFYDHRLNRHRLKNYVRGKRVLDIFSYIGGWGIQAAVCGASEVYCIDSSEKALAQVLENAALNQVASKVQTHVGDAFHVLAALQDANEKFDVIILDPPAFIKKRKDAKEGMNAYRRINELAMRLLPANGLLISASCSLHLPAENLLDILRASSRHLRRDLQVIEQGHQGPDHPVHPAIPETNYLKAFFARVL